MAIERSLWIGGALCAAPEYQDLRDKRSWDIDKPKQFPEAISICAQCPVRELCYDDAVDDRLSEGIRAGVLFKIRTEKDVENKSKIPQYIPMQDV